MPPTVTPIPAISTAFLLVAALLSPVAGLGVNPLPATDLDRVATGSEAPEFRLPDTEGRHVALSDYRGEKHVVLVFYRGHW